MKHVFGCVVLAAMLVGCSDTDIAISPYFKEPMLAEYTVSGEVLKSLPAAKVKIPVSVYNFADQTGQNKPNDTIAEFSHAVTQGGVSILTQALLDASNGGWFTVIERSGLENLIQERKIIRAMRSDYASPDGQKLPAIPPLLYAGMLIEGGITSYESNTLSGGVGARYLGIGGNSEYRRDIVTVYLRAVKVANGEIVMSTSTSKTIYSTNIQGGVYKYIGLNELLEIESGVTMNEPPQLATRQAIEMAVYSLIMEGAQRNLWGFADANAGNIVLSQYDRLKESRRMSFESALKMAEMRGLPKNRADANKRIMEDDEPSLTSQIFAQRKALRSENVASQSFNSTQSVAAPVSAVSQSSPVPVQVDKPFEPPVLSPAPVQTIPTPSAAPFKRYVSPQAATQPQNAEDIESSVESAAHSNGFRQPRTEDYKDKKYLNCGGQGC
jgi:curli production assembly/transport component CsgG